MSGLDAGPLAQGATPGVFRKRPLEITAIRWNGLNEEQISAFLGRTPHKYYIEHGRRSVVLETLEGLMEASMGDWIIRGIAGEFYPCKPDIFEQTYELVSVVPEGETP